MARYSIPDRLLVAIGGNAVHPETTSGTVAEQREYAERTAASLLPLMRLGNQLVLTHGNGPVVGKIMMRQAIARSRVAPMSLDICVAHSQGGVAYLLLQAMENALRAVGNARHVVCLLTQVEVDPDDPAFDDPTKPIGYFYSEEEAEALGPRDRLGDARGFGARLAPRGPLAAPAPHRRPRAGPRHRRPGRGGDRRRRRRHPGAAPGPTAPAPASRR